jgi:alginate export protein
MKKLFVTLALTLSVVAVQAQDAQSLWQALRGGTTQGHFLLRHEAVSLDGMDNNAFATTIRSALGYRTGLFRGVSGFMEAESVAAPFGDDYYANAGAGALNNGVTDRPVVADPVGVEMNQAYLRWASNGVVATVGRQEINLDDVRFVGNVGWRQNRQSFDAARLSYSAEGRPSVTYAFVREAARITGANAPMRSHLAEAKMAVGSIGTVVAHGFFLDWLDAPGLSTATIGGRFYGSTPAGESVTIVYDLAYANQTDAFDNPGTIQANYLHLSAGVKYDRVTLKVGREALSGSASEGAFKSPLATLHKFNGWADQFLGTPPNGLVDLYASASANVGGFSLLAVFHDFSAESGDQNYGSEIDLRITRSFSAGPSAGAKLASYFADGRGADVTKVWLWMGIGL